MAEQDQELIFQGVCTVIKEVIKQLPSDTIIQFVSFSSAMHGLILLDEEKTPLSRMITWADNRAADEAEKLKYTVLGKRILSADWDADSSNDTIEQNQVAAKQPT